MCVVRKVGFRVHLEPDKVATANPRTPLPHRVMQINQLIERLACYCGHSDESELLRMAFLISLRVDSLSELDATALHAHCEAVTAQLKCATEQHAAVSEELDQLADTLPCEFSPDHVWTLVRAIKTQSRFLQMYLGKLQVRI